MKLGAAPTLALAMAATQTSLICCIVGNFNNINTIYSIITSGKSRSTYL